MKLYIWYLVLALSLSPFTCFAQTPSSTLVVPSASADIPKLVKFSGTATDETGKPITGVVGVTFSLYKDQQGGAPLWVETQNVQADVNGHYTAMLGASTSSGVPIGIFSSAEAHWVGAQVSGQREQPRVLLLSVPYALKAADAETLGGLPASAFMHANPGGVAANAGSHSSSGPAGALPPAGVTGTGTKNFIPLWTGTATLGNSVIYETGGNVGIGTKTPGAVVDSTGSGIAVRGNSSGATGTGVFGRATSTTGINYGVQGVNASSQGAGVLGTNTAANGIGLIGRAIKTGVNANIGVQGISSGSLSTGVSGIGVQYGVNGVANGGVNGTAGVYGQANHGGSSIVYGVEGVTASTNGIGVFGNATAKTGNANGVFGQTASPNGVGGLFENTSTSTGAKILVAEDGSGTQRLSVDTQGNVNVVTGTTTQVTGPLVPVNHARTMVNIQQNQDYFVTLNWSFPFPDTNYTVTCTPLASSGFQGEGHSPTCSRNLRQIG